MSKRLYPKILIYLTPVLTLLVLFFALKTVSAQPTQALNEDWRNTDYSFNSRMINTDANNNVYVLGDTPVGYYLTVKKFNSAGALLWQTTYNPVELLRGVWMAVDGNNNPVVLASILTNNGSDSAGWLILKYDTNGNLLWANNLPGVFRDARRLGIDTANNIYATGTMSFDSVLMKFSPSGTTLWTAVFDNNGAIDGPSSLRISPDNGRIGIAGTSGNLFMALMYDANGNLLWSNTNSNVYSANDLAFGPGNVTYFATATYFPQNPNPLQMALAKFDASGNQLWLNSYSVGDITYRVGVDGQGNVLATGIDQAGYLDWMTIKVDANGTLLWSQRYDGGRNNDEIPNMLWIDSADAVYITGTGGPNPSSGNISYLKGVVAKYNSSGSPQWAVWDDYAGGKAISLGSGNTLTTLGFGYLVTTRYTQTGLPDTLPLAPTNLIGFTSPNGPNYNAHLSFSDNANNEFWVEIERCTGSGCSNFLKVGQTIGENGTAYMDQNLLPGTTYVYRVRALGFMGGSEYSNTLEIITPGGTVPAPPSNLTAVLNGATVLLNWQDNANNESQFYIDRCQGAGCTNFSAVGSTGANITTWTDLTVMPGQSYSYRVRAWNANGYSGYSNIATLIVSGNPPPAPSNLIAQAISKSEITLTWTNNSSSQNGVKIERCLGARCTNFVQIAVITGNTASYTDFGLTANTAYRYRVRTYNTWGNSPYSNIAGAKTFRR